MKLYKLTDENGQTYGGTQWGPGVTHETNGEGGLCGPGWLHAYTDPLLAVLLNPIHANFKNPRLWDAEGEVGADDRGLKCGTTRLTTLREIPLPEITDENRVRFATLCAIAVGGEYIPQWAEWARQWLSGKRRSIEAAEAAMAADRAARAARATDRAADRAAAAADAAWAAEAAEAAMAADRAADRAAAEAAEAAMAAAEAAAEAADRATDRAAAWAAMAAEAAAWAAEAAEAAAWAAEAAARSDRTIDLATIAHEAVYGVQEEMQ